MIRNSSIRSHCSRSLFEIKMWRKSQHEIKTTVPSLYLFTEIRNFSSHKANVCKPKCILPIQQHDDMSEENVTKQRQKKKKKQNKPLIF